MARRAFNPKAFVDSLRVYVKGGTGGKGLMRYGGIGGRGGNVCAVCDRQADLKHLRNINPKLRFVAGVGDDSRRLRLVGNPGEDVEISAPPGVIIKIDSGRILGELNEHGDKVLVAKGGDGASPKNRFKQEKGHVLNITLDLKLIADIGLVGFPNAGKSTLLGVLSRAAPKVAAYPFTTMQPQIGTMEYTDTRQITVADLPGLIEGAHINMGMGHKFLKHIERTKLMLFMVDLHGFRLKVGSPIRSPFETVVLLMKELELYRENLVHKPAVLVLNKTDIPGSKERVDEVVHKVKNISEYLPEIDKPLWPDNPIEFRDIVTISARTKSNTEELKSRLRLILDEIADENTRTATSFEEYETNLARALTERQSGKRMI